MLYCLDGRVDEQHSSPLWEISPFPEDWSKRGLVQVPASSDLPADFAALLLRETMATPVQQRLIQTQ